MAVFESRRACSLTVKTAHQVRSITKAYWLFSLISLFAGLCTVNFSLRVLLLTQSTKVKTFYTNHMNCGIWANTFFNMTTGLIREHQKQAIAFHPLIMMSSNSGVFTVLVFLDLSIFDTVDQKIMICKLQSSSRQLLCGWD